MKLTVCMSVRHLHHLALIDVSKKSHAVLQGQVERTNLSLTLLYAHQLVANVRHDQHF